MGRHPYFHHTPSRLMTVDERVRYAFEATDHTVLFVATASGELYRSLEEAKQDPTGRACGGEVREWNINNSKLTNWLVYTFPL